MVAEAVSVEPSMSLPVMVGVVTVGATSRTVAVAALVCDVAWPVSSVNDATTVMVVFSSPSVSV